MGTSIAGLIFVVVGVLLWAGIVTLGHAFAIFLIVLGVALVLFYFLPGGYTRRVR